LDDAERAVDDAFNTFRVLRGEQRFLTGAGGVEAQLANRVKEFALREPGLDQYAY